MKLTEAQQSAVVARLDELAITWQSCRACVLSSGWNVSPIVFEVAQHGGGRYLRELKVMPLIVVTCRRCGHVMLFSAEKLGVGQAGHQAP